MSPSDEVYVVNSFLDQNATENLIIVRASNAALSPNMPEMKLMVIRDQRDEKKGCKVYCGFNVTSL